jgi:hypothetical protein
VRLEEKGLTNYLVENGNGLILLVNAVDLAANIFGLFFTHALILFIYFIDIILKTLI